MQAEILGMLVACICHDLDHRGTNNTFERKRNNPLARLYSTSTLERHHLNHCLLLLNIKGNGILDNLSKVNIIQSYGIREVFTFWHSCFLTDPKIHFSRMNIHWHYKSSNRVFLQLIWNNILDTEMKSPNTQIWIPAFV